jgi:transposase
MPSTRAQSVVAVGLAVKPVGKPDAGNPHVRFDERGRETERFSEAPPRPSSTLQIVGRKRHIAVDTDGRLLLVNLTPADISDSAGAQAILDGIRKRWPWVKHLFADAAYDRLKFMDKAAYLDFVIEIIRRSDDQKGFEVLPRRWVVVSRTILPTSLMSGRCTWSAQTLAAGVLRPVTIELRVDLSRANQSHHRI